MKGNAILKLRPKFAKRDSSNSKICYQHLNEINLEKWSGIVGNVYIMPLRILHIWRINNYADY